ncbi:MAG: hypothetical protein JO291_04065 [Acidimicrobiia bacterium]|nr:hypothetical protein [Acidimicrobiia bacterium]
MSAPDHPLHELVCITGMHRSGTSLLARVVNLLGVSLGDEGALMGPGPDNPSGYWENRWVKELDDELLAHLGGAWDQPPLLTGDWALDPTLDPFRERAAEIVARDLARGTACRAGCKEPRLCLLHPFWRTVVPIRSTVVVVREPGEVAASLARRNGMDPAQGAALWLRYLFAATTEPALVVSLDDLTDRPEPTALRLAAHLGLPEPGPDVLARIRAHHDPSILHRKAPASSSSEVAVRSPNMELASAVWGGGSVDLDAVGPAVRTALAEGWLGPPANRAAIDRARAENVELNEKLRKWHRKRRAQKLKQVDVLLPPLPDGDDDDVDDDDVGDEGAEP